MGQAYMKRVAENKMVSTVRWEEHVEKAFFLLWVLGICRIVVIVNR